MISNRHKKWAQSCAYLSADAVNDWKLWSHPPGSNRRPADYESAALPTELGWPIVAVYRKRGSFSLPSA
jgi:hypothetical protein